jgi:protein O-mannosyl-transferase
MKNINILAYLILIILITIYTYHNIANYSFINIDDDAYVYANRYVISGLNKVSLVWAFTAIHASNWHPLTTISHLIDCTLFGLNPNRMHIINLVIHLLNITLIFFLLKSINLKYYIIICITGIIALHPLNVESVVWISERKNLLYSVFYILSIILYILYVRNGKLINLFLFIFFYICSLLCKPMAVTLPAILVLVDYLIYDKFFTLQKVIKDITNKLYLFVMSLIFCIITYRVQNISEATYYEKEFTTAHKFFQSFINLRLYIYKIFFPKHLSVIYFNFGILNILDIILSIILFLSITYFVFKLNNKLVVFGWLWFILSAIPILGLVGVGAQTIADRYVYLPMLGLIIMFFIILDIIIIKYNINTTLVLFLYLLLMVMLLNTTNIRIHSWSNSISLLKDSISNGEDNPALRYLYGTALIDSGVDRNVADDQFKLALKLKPDYVNALTQLAISELNRGNYLIARNIVNKTIAIKPNNTHLYENLGSIDLYLNNTSFAKSDYIKSLEKDQNNIIANLELARIYYKENNTELSLKYYRFVAKLAIWDPVVLTECASCLANSKYNEESKILYNKIEWLTSR